MTTPDPHGQPVTVTPTSRDKQLRKSLATALMVAGLGFSSLQQALPYLHNIPWLPSWLPAIVGIAAGSWQSWKQYRDGGNQAIVNYSPPVRDLREGIPAPPVAYWDAVSLPAVKPLDTSGDIPENV